MLIERIEELRELLNTSVENKCLDCDTVLNISRELDEIIVEYLKSRESIEHKLF